MTKEEKQLLLKGLCARLLYGVICHTEEGDGYLCSINQTIFGTEYGININPLKRDYFNDSETEEQAVKPYLRPMSSMTEEEKEEIRQQFCYEWEESEVELMYYSIEIGDADCLIDWFLEHHLDFRGLIPKGLALEAPEGMYKTK